MIYGNAVVIDGAEIALTAVIDGGEILLAQQIDDGVQSFMPIVPQYDEYEGETVVTPTEETQTLLTADLIVPANITINPIPSNYGRITWDGTKIVVS